MAKQPTATSQFIKFSVKSHQVGRPQFTHLTTLPECWRPSAAVRGDLHVSTLKPYACLIGV